MSKRPSIRSKATTGALSAIAAAIVALIAAWPRRVPEEKGAVDGGRETVHHPGWNRPKPDHIPRSTYWPVVLAAGIMGIAWGIITGWWIFALGLLVFIVGIVGWVGDLLYEG